MKLHYATLALGSLVVACSSSTTIIVQDGGGAGFGSGPPIPASQVGGVCTNVGTSPGDTATFTMADCPAGICVADARTGIDAYCTADCAAHSCPAGFICQAITLGVTKYACVKDQNGGGDSDAGTGTAADASPACALARAQGSYSESYTTTTSNCPPVSPRAVTIQPGAGILESGPGSTGCTSSEDLSLCTLTEDCTVSADAGTFTEHTVASPAGSSIKGTMTFQFAAGTGPGLTCAYSVTFTP
jgi:hypothetical protein